MNRKKFILAFAFALLLAIASIVFPGPTNPYIGEWDSIDIPDGSYQEMFIDGSPSAMHIRWVDYGASVCGDFDKNGDPTTAANIAGTGYIDSGALFFDDLPVVCLYLDGRGNVTLFNVSGRLKDMPNGTLLDGGGLVWTRIK